LDDKSRQDALIAAVEARSTKPSALDTASGRFHIETAGSQKMGSTTVPSPSTYFVDIVAFLSPDGTVAAPELPELDRP
jgi:hypothetical protein